jgi:hypothetical protein
VQHDGGSSGGPNARWDRARAKQQRRRRRRRCAQARTHGGGTRAGTGDRREETAGGRVAALSLRLRVLVARVCWRVLCSRARFGGGLLLFFAQRRPVRFSSVQFSLAPAASTPSLAPHLPQQARRETREGGEADEESNAKTARQQQRKRKCAKAKESNAREGKEKEDGRGRSVVVCRVEG